MSSTQDLTSGLSPGVLLDKHSFSQAGIPACQEVRRENLETGCNFFPPQVGGEANARRDAARVLVLLASVSAIHGEPTPCPLGWVAYRTGIAQNRLLALLEGLVAAGMIERTPDGWAMDPVMHRVCMEQAEGAR